MSNNLAVLLFIIFSVTINKIDKYLVTDRLHPKASFILLRLFKILPIGNFKNETVCEF